MRKPFDIQRLALEVQIQYHCTVYEHIPPVSALCFASNQISVHIPLRIELLDARPTPPCTDNDVATHEI